MTYEVNYDLIEKGMIELEKHNLNQEERLQNEIRNNPLKFLCVLEVSRKLQADLTGFERDVSRKLSKYINRSL